MPRLKHIAEVQIGYQATGRMLHDRRGTHRLLQLKDVRDGKIVLGNLLAFVPRRTPDPYVVRPNDILLVARGRVNCAILNEAPLADVVAVSNFYLVRAKANVLPAFLCWYLNQAPAQEFIRSRAHGSGIKMIGKSDLLELPVPVPPPEVQRQVVAVARLAEEEEQLVRAISSQRQKLVATVCGRAIASKDKEA